MLKRPARVHRSMDPDLEELYEARNWNATWQAVLGEEPGGERHDDGDENGEAGEDDVISPQIEHAVRCAAWNLADH